MVFLYDDREYTYADLLSAVSGSAAYCPLLRSKELFPFFVNMVKALAALPDLTPSGAFSTTMVSHGFTPHFSIPIR